MLNIKYIKKYKNYVIKSLKLRKFKNKNIINKILLLYNKINKKNIILNKYLNILKNNYKNKNLIIKKKNYKNINIIKIKKKKIKNIINNLKNKYLKYLIKVPNILNKKYFLKKNNNNKIIYNNYKNIKNKIKKKKYLSHIELSKKYDIFETKISSKISGTGFVIYYGLGLLLYNSLVRFLLSYNNKKGYKEYILPYLVNKNSIYGTGQFPDKKNQVYNIKKDNLYLIPTGEVPLVNFYSNKIFNYKDLPIKSQTYTQCFRREAGSYGKKVKGLNRLHQFGKVEIIEISDNNSNIRLNKMLKHIKNVLKLLKLYFRIKLLSSEKIGITSSITYDFEVYSFGQKKWLEVSSLSNCLNYQSNELKIYYYNKSNKKELCNTLNGSCISIPRLLLCIIEMYQNNNGIKIPKVLIPYYKNNYE